MIHFPTILITFYPNSEKIKLSRIPQSFTNDDIYSSCDENDFYETQLIEPSSSEDSKKDDSIVENEEVRPEKKILPNVQVN